MSKFNLVSVLTFRLVHATLGNPDNVTVKTSPSFIEEAPWYESVSQETRGRDLGQCITIIHMSLLRYVSLQLDVRTVYSGAWQGILLRSLTGQFTGKCERTVY